MHAIATIKAMSRHAAKCWQQTIVNAKNASEKKVAKLQEAENVERRRQQ